MSLLCNFFTFLLDGSLMILDKCNGRIPKPLFRSAVLLSLLFAAASELPASARNSESLNKETHKGALEGEHEQSLTQRALETDSDCSSHYFASQDFPALLRNLQSMNSELQVVRLQQLKSDFEQEVRQNKQIISNLALTVIETLLSGSALLAADVLLASSSAGLPKCLRDHLDSKSSAQILKLAQSTEAARTTVHLHPFWHKDPTCRVGVNGRITFAHSDPQAIQGLPLYIQKICANKKDNKLLQATVPHGKDHLYVSPPDSGQIQNTADSITLHDTNEKHGLSFQLAVGSGLGQIGKNDQKLISGGPTAKLFQGTYSFVECSIQLTQRISILVDLAPVKMPMHTGNAPEVALRNSARDGLFSQISLSAQKNFRVARWSIAPQLGAGVSTLVPGRASIKRATFVAPHALFRSMLAFPLGDSQISIIGGPLLTTNLPPFSGWTAAFLVGVELNSK